MRIRPLSLEVVNFLGIENCKLDFKEGVFLIVGQNGAGKSSLLEAIVFALYGMGVRYGKKSPQDYIRSSTDTCQVRFSFLRNGKKYEVLRKVKSSGTEALLTENGTIIATQRTHVDRELQKILNTTYESFISTFFLPQGRATYLLTAKRSEINDIVFDVLFPKKILRSVQEKVNELMKNLQIEHEKKQARLSDLRIRAEQIINAVSPEKIEFYSKKSQELQQQLALTEQKLKSIEQQMTVWQQIKQIEKNLEQLKNQRDRLVNRAEEERKISLASSVAGEYQILLNVQEKVESLQKEQNKMHEQIKKHESDILKIDHELENFKTNQNKVEQLMVQLSSQRDQLQKIDLQSEPLLNELNQLRTAKTFLEQQKENLNGNLSTVEKKICERQDILAKLNSALEQSEKEYDQIRQQALIWMSQEIAQNLQDGDTCPVCGNVFHRTAHEQQRVDIQRYQQLKNFIEKNQRQIEQINAEINSLVQEKENLDESLRKASKDLSDCIEKINEIERNLQQIGYDSLVKHRIRELSKQIEDLFRKKVQIQSEISKLTGTKEQLSRRIEELKNDIEVISSQLIQQKVKLDESKKGFFEKLERIGLTFKEFEIYSQKTMPEQSSLEMIHKIDLQIEKSYEELDKLKKSVTLEYETCESHYRELTDELEAIKKQREEYIRQKAIAEHMMKELKEIEQQKKDLQNEFEVIHRQYQITELVKNTLSAKEFQSFVTNMVLEGIITKTNDMLDTLTDGRFKIKIEESGFVIMDSGIERSADGLSGGEKTVVSLALAIAIAEMATGNMEIFFIDEGFSALDEDNKFRIAGALKQMEKLNKIIGFVTHDPQFAEYFDKKLVVEKGGVVRWT